VVERSGDESAFVDQAGGGPVARARLGITLDGYSAPLTAGNFAANVTDGLYNGRPLNASYASVLVGRGALPGR
jgi:cyclophilin family peptidyl-prolyl cis-trans isomerase